MVDIREQIESKIDIVDLVREYVPLKKAGANFKALSPFTKEKTPSFVVSPAKQIAYCFSTNRGGWAIKFLMEIENISYYEALSILAKKVGIELQMTYSTKKDANIDLYKIYDIAASMYHDMIFQEENKKILEYVRNRGITDKTIKKFKIGYSSDPKDIFWKIKESDVEEKVILSSGLFSSPNRDQFFGRVVFPISNYRGQTVAFSGRVTDNSLPKYVNSPATDIFDKSSVLFGLHLAKTDIVRNKKVIIVEWQMDVIALHQAGFPYTVGISGIALTEYQIRTLKRLTPIIYLCLDNDKAGIQATMNSIKALVNSGVDIRIIDLWKYKDPDEALKSWENFEDFLKKSLTHITFLIKKGESQYDISTVQGKKGLIDEIFLFLSNVLSSIELDVYLREISNLLGVSLNILYDEFYNKFSKKPQKTKYEKKIQENNPAVIFEQVLMFLLQDNSYQKIFNKIFLFQLEELTFFGGAELFNYIKKWEIDAERRKILDVYFENTYHECNHNKRKLIFQDLLQRLQKYIYSKKEQKIQEKIKEFPEDEKYLREKIELMQIKNKIIF